MSPLQGRWVVEVTFPFVGASPYAILFDPIGVTQCPNDRWGYECPVGAI